MMFQAEEADKEKSEEKADGDTEAGELEVGRFELFLLVR